MGIMAEIYAAYTGHPSFPYLSGGLTAIIAWNTSRLIKKRISIADGEHYAEGEITYSEHGRFAGDMNWRPETVVTYKYIVEGQLHTGLLYLTVLHGRKKIKSIAESYPAGTRERVYYSKDDHDYSELGRKPDREEVFFYTALGQGFNWLMFNLLFGFVLWVLSHAPQ